MEKQLTIIIVEDDRNECQALMNYAETISEIQVLGATDNEVKAIELTKDCQPDAVILDLELHKGQGNGLNYLRQLKGLDLQFLPFILVTTHNVSTIIYNQARDLGADFIISKAQTDYSAKMVVDFLFSMKKMIHNRAAAYRLPSEISTPETMAQLNKRLEIRINNELNLVGISPKALGYKYLVDAIMLIIKKQDANIKTYISQKYRKTEASVERAVQNSINNAWKTSDIDDLCKYYTARVRSEKGSPTMMEFIYYYANKIKNSF